MMSAKGSARSAVTFHDVAVYFSEEEWEFLEDWRKELYKSVMCEIHGVLISMGYAIVNPDTLFRIKKEEKPFVSHLPACKKTENFQGHTSGSSVVCPDILLRIKQEDNPVRYNPPPCKKRENIINPAPHHAAETAIISMHIKEEEDPYMSEPPHSDRSESFSSPTTSSPIVTSVFSLNNKPVDSSYSRGRQDLGKGFLDIPPEASLKAEELDAPCKKPIDDSERSSKECPHLHDKNKKEELMANTFQCYFEENKENEATAKAAPNNSEAKKRNDIRMKETFKNKHTILQQTTIIPSQYQENLPRETSLPNRQFDFDNQHLSASIFPLVEKLETFVDLQKKQYEALKGSVRQMNVYLHSQTRTLIKINSSIQRQTSAINQLARAQQASATNIETLAANVLQTNTNLVEGNAALNKTLQGALDMLQVVIKTHFQQEGSTTKDGSTRVSPLVEPTTKDMTSAVRPTAGLRRSISGGRKLEEPSTRKRRKERMRNTSVDLIPL